MLVFYAQTSKVFYIFEDGLWRQTFAVNTSTMLQIPGDGLSQSGRGLLSPVPGCGVLEFSGEMK